MGYFSLISLFVVQMNAELCVKLWVDIGKASERIFTQEAESSDVESAVFVYSLTQEKSESSVKDR